VATDEKYLHLVSCSAAGEVVAETLRRLGRAEEIIEGYDSLHEGPIHDVDSGAASRVEWWSRLRYGLDVDTVDEPAESNDFDDADVWREVASRPTSVIIWHGPHPMEHAFMLRTCWYLREQPDRVHEVVLAPSGKVWCGAERPTFYDSVPLAGPDETTAAWQRRDRVADERLTARSRRWEELRADCGEWIRLLDGDDLVQKPLTIYDDALLRACDDWRASLTAVGIVLGHNPTCDAFLFWRVRELLRLGKVVGRGGTNRVGLPTELRAADASTLKG
jgi:hypothetical protein